MGFLDFLFGSRKERTRRRASAAARKRRLEAQAERLEERRHRLEGERRMRAEDELARLRHRLSLASARAEVERAERETRRAASERNRGAARARAEYRQKHAGEPRPPANERLELAHKLARSHGGTVEGWEKILARTGVSKPSERGVNPTQRRARMHAACGGLCIKNPSPESWSQEFHGTPTKTKDGKVVVGTLENVRYRAPAGSSRAGVLWDHQVLDRGVLRPRATKKPLLVADPNSGRVSISGGDMRFRPSHGLVG